MTFGMLLWKVWQLSAVGVTPILKIMLKQLVHCASGGIFADHFHSGTQYYLIVFCAFIAPAVSAIY